MWIISVEPMPSMISMPVACLKSWRVASGSASPAETHFFRLREVVVLGELRHLAVEGRRGEADGRA